MTWLSTVENLILDILNATSTTQTVQTFDQLLHPSNGVSNQNYNQIFFSIAKEWISRFCHSILVSLIAKRGTALSCYSCTSLQKKKKAYHQKPTLTCTKQKVSYESISCITSTIDNMPATSAISQLSTQTRLSRLL